MNGATGPGRAYLTGANAAGAFGPPYKSSNYMIDGKPMTFKEFIDTLYPEDCAEKTMMVLRLKKED